MTTRTIKIGNMCCDRCIMVVSQVLARHGIRCKKVELGAATVYEATGIDEKKLEKDLEKSGFAIIHSKEDAICEKIKIAIHRIFFDIAAAEPASFNLKNHLESQTGMTYKKLTDIFSKNTQTTIEKYFIRHRIEKVKELIEDTDHSFTEIAFRLGYNSLSHLSRQFREIEGLSMHDYKHKHVKNRKPIDKL